MYKAKDKKTHEVVALKRVRLDEDDEVKNVIKISVQKSKMYIYTYINTMFCKRYPLLAGYVKLYFGSILKTKDFSKDQVMKSSRLVQCTIYCGVLFQM